jgi:phosphatidylglycerol:prolipoprotein diacylglycerol transferase
MLPLEVVGAGPYNLFYTLAVAAAAGSMFVAGRRRGWRANGWGLAVAAWVAAGMLGAMLPRVILGDLVAYRTAIGAVIFSTLMLGIIAQALDREVGDLLDTTAVSIPLGAAIVRVGCFFAECCQGIATSLPIGIALHPDDVPRHPVQLYESVLETGLAMLIARRASWARPGRQFASSLLGMCAIRFGTEFVRDNDQYGGLSLAQWVVLPVGLLCFILLLSRPRAARPRRVLTTGARQATIIAVGALAIAAVAAGLPALEATVLLLGTALVIIASIRRVGRVAPTGLAVLALQMPAMSADSTYPRTYRFFGAGANMGMWDYVHRYSDCEGTTNEEWTRHHTASGASFELGARQQLSETHGVGIRGRAYYGTDHVGAAVVKSGTPASPAAFTRTSSGAQAVVDADWKWFGISLGFSAGRFYPMSGDDSYGAGEKLDGVSAFPAAGLRFGPRHGVSVEMRVGDESPMWVPGPAGSIAIALGDHVGNRIRLGTSDGGFLVAGEKFTANGLEVLPTFVLNPGASEVSGNVFQGGITFRKWIR